MYISFVKNGIYQKEHLDVASFMPLGYIKTHFWCITVTMNLINCAECRWYRCIILCTRCYLTCTFIIRFCSLLYSHWEKHQLSLVTLFNLHHTVSPSNKIMNFLVFTNMMACTYLVGWQILEGTWKKILLIIWCLLGVLPVGLLL